MEFSELVIFVASLVVSYQFGKHSAYRKLRSEGTQRQNNAPNVYKLMIEREHDMLYLYDYDVGTFLCQASNIDDLACIAKQHKNIKYASVMDIHTNSVFAFVDGKVEKKY